MSRDDHAQLIESAVAAKGKTRHCYSAHNCATTLVVEIQVLLLCHQLALLEHELSSTFIASTSLTDHAVVIAVTHDH